MTTAIMTDADLQKDVLDELTLRMQALSSSGELDIAAQEFSFTIPREEVERQGLEDGELVALEVRKVTIRPAVAADLQPHVETLRGNENLRGALRRLKDA